MTKYHSLDDLENRNLFLTILEDQKSKIKVPANSVSGEGSFPGLGKELPSYCVLT